MIKLFDYFKKKKKPLAIAAIFRNEKEYIVEWLAWHLSQGFEHFIIYDNESDDGTTELLQRLASKKIITFHSIPRQDKVQITAYSEVISNYKAEFDLIAFIDADEFMMPMDDSPASKHIFNLFQDKNIGALGINWRVFGTNGLQNKPNGHVIESYHLAGNNSRPRNHYIKSIYRPEAVINIFPHRAELKENYRYITTEGKDLTFATWKNFPAPTPNNQTSGVSCSISVKNLRINHYALKSVEEFLNKKKYKGSCIAGVYAVKGDSYFEEHDLNDEKVSIRESHIQRFKKQYTQLQSQLD